MKKIISILLIVVLTTSACNLFTPKQSKLTGNVYFKQNEFIGFKADVGSKIFLYPADSTSLIYFATADLLGNYEINKIKPGTYLMVITSNNSNECDYMALSNFALYENYYKKYFKFNLEPYHKTMLNINSDTKKLNSFFNSLPSYLLNKIGKNISYLRNYQIKEITVSSDKPINIITDLTGCY